MQINVGPVPPLPIATHGGQPVRSLHHVADHVKNTSGLDLHRQSLPCAAVQVRANTCQHWKHAVDRRRHETDQSHDGAALSFVLEESASRRCGIRVATAISPARTRSREWSLRELCCRKRAKCAAGDGEGAGARGPFSNFEEKEMDPARRSRRGVGFGVGAIFGTWLSLLNTESTLNFNIIAYNTAVEIWFIFEALWTGGVGKNKQSIKMDSATLNLGIQAGEYAVKMAATGGVAYVLSAGVTIGIICGICYVAYKYVHKEKEAHKNK
ncbi:hypothetical protein Zmor_027808 [Zophobas morio]|uniref:Uncharacterized protein n=1 Tax=Zophobas morio TaxID=2755281 RepID=A0AA38HPV4_9CUCU|nr:hypothetical protein Zmor_027808 [Zophobas morio]